MIRSGLDWSGDGGDLEKRGSSRKLVTVIAHIDQRDLTALVAACDRARRARRLPPDYTFKYSGARPEIRGAFFSEIERVPLTAHAVIVDKRDWSESYLRGSSGQDRVVDSIVALISQCPDDLIAGQVLLIDISVKETVIVDTIRAAVKRALVGSGRRSFSKVKPCPDHRADGIIIQVADMIAGALQDRGAVIGPLLAPMGSRIVIC